MKMLIAVLLILHGLIHLPGFVKAFQLADIGQLSLPVSKIAGIAWLLSAMLFLLSAGLLLAGNADYWMACTLAVLLSQIMIFTAWQDAKFGTLVNVLIVGLVGYVVLKGR